MINPIRLKRIYDPLEEEDGARILVDRTWPRGVRKLDVQLSWWAKDVAPSTDLRKWFRHDSSRWTEFRRRYRDELAEKPETLSLLLDYCRQGPVTLLFGARDRNHNQAVVLQEVLQKEVTEEGTANKSTSPVCYEGEQ